MLFSKKKIKLFTLALTLIFAGICVCGGILFVLELRSAAKKIPQLPNIITQIGKEPTKILSADGKLLYVMSTEYRQPVQFKEIPKSVINATLAAEDKRFYEHDGIDFISLIRGLFANVKGGRIAQGGSTLTMQIAKRVYTSSRQTLRRKLQDMALAIMMERELTKDQILELYLNQVYFGSGAYGIKAAAEIYFGKDLKKLTIGEAALLSRLVKKPSKDNPFISPKLSIINRNFVLKTMLEEKMITEKEYETALNEKLKLRSKDHCKTTGKKLAPYFVDYVIAMMKRNHPDADISCGGYTIETTLNYHMQTFTEKQVKAFVDKNKYRDVSTGGFLLTDREGRILSMVGGRSYEKNQYNMIWQGRRQPGSSFKPFIYTAGLVNENILPTSNISNERYYWHDPRTGKIWAPRNDNKRYGGNVSLRSAIAQSLNLTCIRTAEMIGGRKTISLIKSIFGFKSHLDPGLAIALGCSEVSPMEMAVAYSVFMLQGKKYTPFGIYKVIGPDGMVINEQSPHIHENTLNEKWANTMDGFLRNAVLHGTGYSAKRVINARGKTGTTNSHIDSWFCGYTNELLGISWIGNEVRDNSGKNPRWVYKPMKRVYGGTIAAPMWASILSHTQKIIGEQSKDNLSPSLTVSSNNKQNNNQTENLASNQTMNDDSGEPMPATTNQDFGSKTTSALNKSSQFNQQNQTLKDKESLETVQTTPKKLDEISKTSTRKTISADICAESGLKAGTRCRAIIMKTFTNGNEPKDYCDIH